MDYDELYDRAEEKISETVDEERFEVPEPETMQEGEKTIIKNFSKIADKLRRPEEHMMNFLRRELGVPGSVDGSRAVFQGRITERKVSEKVNQYVDEFVICPACDKVDTKLVEEERIKKIKCEACGAKQAVRQF
ncbi:MAG: translation initiation factor IF-2 subunit beta [Candidatus Aenigmatarchaeota archaeon]